MLRLRSLLRLRAPLLACVTALVATAPAVAWGPNGHRAGGAIAYSYLTPEARKAVDDLLGGQSLADASNWADEIRSNNAYDWVKPLHYVNIPRGADKIDLSRDCPGGNCVVAAITKYADVLRDPKSTRDQRIEALKLLAHFVEDVHQPLHASYADDKGGNMITVKLFGKRTNLHALWDSGMIDHRLGKGGSWDKWASSVRGRITDQNLKQWRASIDPSVWANESVSITKRLYAGLPANGEIGDPYIDANFNAVEERIAMAGVRLAAVLNSALGGAAPKDGAAETAPAGKPETSDTTKDAPKGAAKNAPKDAPKPATKPAAAPESAPAAAPTAPKTPATPSRPRALGTFEVSMTSQSSNLQPNGEGKPAPNPANPEAPMTGATLERMLVTKRYRGQLEGSGRGELLTARSGVPGSAGYVALELVTATIDGRSGTFVLLHTGTMDRGTGMQTATVVPDSATGQLAGLTGSMKIVLENGKHSYEFEYEMAGK
ncbi:MAG: S1/P1 nuclease [Phycisphaerales bacterium]